jgi:hypothetical protein
MELSGDGIRPRVSEKHYYLEVELTYFLAL